MNTGKVILLGMARPGFDTDLATRVFHDSVAAVEKLGYSVTRKRWQFEASARYGAEIGGGR